MTLRNDMMILILYIKPRGDFFFFKDFRSRPRACKIFVCTVATRREYKLAKRTNPTAADGCVAVIYYIRERLPDECNTSWFIARISLHARNYAPR